MKNLSLVVFVFIGQTVLAQQTVGTLTNTGSSYDGYTLFAPMSSTVTYLIDNCGQLVNSWSATNRPGLSAYLLEDGSLLRTKNLNNANFNSGGSAGGVQRFDWDGTLLWDHEVSNGTECQHHDVEYLPNGNVLMIVWETRSQAEAIQAGRNPANAPSLLWPDKIIEVEPSGSNGGTVVWEWNSWDHLIQDNDPTKDNYGVVADHPELIDINYPYNSNSDWLHTNSVDYNLEFDQIVISIHNTSEIWIIDHSTTTAEAASHIGGNSGRGGDLLYRWGNPQAYDRGNPSTRKFYAQHDARWISEGTDIGRLMVFNNGQAPTRLYSTVDVIDLPVDGIGYYTQPSSGNSFLPTDHFWSYEAPTNTDFYASNISGAHRLPNNNTLICEGPNGRLFEVNTSGDIVWEYQSPVGNNGPVEQGTDLSNGNSIFRCTRYSSDYSGFDGRDLTPGNVIELNSNYPCNLFANPTGLVEGEEKGIEVVQNYGAGYVSIHNLPKDGLLRVYDSYGRLIHSQSVINHWETLNSSFWPPGVYFIEVFNSTSYFSQKILNL